VYEVATFYYHVQPVRLIVPCVLNQIFNANVPVSPSENILSKSAPHTLHVARFHGDSERCLYTLGGIKPGQTTKDGKFTVIEVECQGACSNAPMMVVGDDFYVRSSPRWICLLVSDCAPTHRKTSQSKRRRKILDAFSKGQKPKPGPQSGRQTSENSAV